MADKEEDASMVVLCEPQQDEGRVTEDDDTPRVDMSWVADCIAARKLVALPKA